MTQATTRAMTLEPDFAPVQPITTMQAWRDLDLPDRSRARLTALGRRISLRRPPAARPLGLRALFSGPPGSGKTLAATLLGRAAGRDVLRVDLAAVTSKYIGETEKNLDLLLARGEIEGAILLFDEADALFGRRTSLRDGHDRFANQEVSYLLDRAEAFPGVVLLVANSGSHFDDALLRRFDAVIRFPPPRFAAPDDS